MFLRLTIADVKEGEINNALEYVKNTVIPSYDGLPGLLGLAHVRQMMEDLWRGLHGLTKGLKRPQ